MGTTPIREWQLRMLANSLEYRGNDATGFALMDIKGGISWIKKNDPAWRFTASKEYKEWMHKHLTERENDIVVALVHTRKATVGSPFKSENNHPITTDSGGAIVHNGHISNHEALFQGGQYGKRNCETDSDAIRAILDTYGVIDKGLIEVMGDLEGAAAVAAIHPASPGKVLLLRDSNPLLMGATREMLIWASDKTSIHRAIKPWVKMHGMWMQLHAPDLAFVPVANQTGWIIGEEGLEWHGEFKCNSYGRSTGNTKYSASLDYHERHKRYREEKTLAETVLALPRWVICPNAECSKHIQVPEDWRKNPTIKLEHLECGGCRTQLNMALSADYAN